MTAEGRFGSGVADVVHFEVMGKEIHPTTEWILSAADVPVVCERVPLAHPVASINRTLVPGSAPRLPPAVFSIGSNKVQLLPCLPSEPCYRRTVQSHWCVCEQRQTDLQHSLKHPWIPLKSSPDPEGCSVVLRHFRGEGEVAWWGFSLLLLLLLLALGEPRGHVLHAERFGDLRTWTEVVRCSRNFTLNWLKITGAVFTCAIRDVGIILSLGKKPVQCSGSGYVCISLWPPESSSPSLHVLMNPWSFLSPSWIIVLYVEYLKQNCVNFPISVNKKCFV